MANTAPRKRAPLKAENAPIRVWMVDVPGGYIEVSNLYMWIKFPRSRGKMEFRIDGKKLEMALKQLSTIQTVGKLDFWGLDVNGEKLVVISPNEDDAGFPFEFEVNQRELSEALFYFLN
ncbi:hypothetical protein A3K29_05060 [Candidatus Collierbacteria bacterium RIFOXYB2_FULL_46_14]|uniref:Uncharacterized protein n=1 Tax=Candidatus Collierbacteria bacterium GW2011_GWA2_46_26 TaxID=1618381 RepID=A0A0G1RSX5_9BACT|nr:MAG: hypothetical protein UX47_C0006G0024 [Candidatus Collierbacteria bacterium GW2011_GWA2_46_26]OGD73466.1 MAG: hypothetical protein A3K29_05060 [Candidatus Collierbacteria bacterium RIFOXYB2_FULL_46_14]OGD76508.1 MAG: hypothetical protein A3K43_05060 [Candidatus Collierbacteria bacterium RIFOXYA2_FULL_46_20]OGD77844.1 MAG: hypothetical protein A3K39_05060 [Candidatus Collierbacteria bacterium RIFOXYC2_FULL_43_15]OGD82566.1 MAG: hypothetical protein A3K36_05060 [Candidatus Collierbacteria 